MKNKEDEVDAQPLWDHFLDFRKRVIYSLLAISVGFCASYFFASEIFAFLVRPLAEASEVGRRMIYTGPAEAFVTHIKLALWMGCFLAFPVVAYQIWAFAAPAMYREEKRALLPFIAVSPILFVTGAAMAYYAVFPMAWRFFLSFETPASAGNLPVQMEARVSEYLSLSMDIIFAFGLVFQLPVILVLLVRAGVLSAEKLSKFRRYAIVLSFAVAAVITPPDVISQICLAVPMVVLYEISIIAARRVSRSDPRPDKDD